MIKKNNLISLLILSLVLVFISCKSYKIIEINEKYSNKKLFVSEVYIVNCIKDNCNTILTDSLIDIMKGAFDLLELDIEYSEPLTNIYNDTVWNDTFPPKYYFPKKINYDYIKSYPYEHEGLKLIPFIYFLESKGFSTAHHTYNVRVQLKMFIIKNGETIYEVYSWNSKTTNYVPSIDDFKKEDINTVPIIYPAIFKALAPYIERSGNGRVIKEKKDRKKRRNKDVINVFN